MSCEERAAVGCRCVPLHRHVNERDSRNRLTVGIAGGHADISGVVIATDAEDGSNQLSSRTDV